MPLDSPSSFEAEDDLADETTLSQSASVLVSDSTDSVLFVPYLNAIRLNSNEAGDLFSHILTARVPMATVTHVCSELMLGSCC